MRGFIAAIIVAFFTWQSALAKDHDDYPDHAQCLINWDFGMTCKEVRDLLIVQIKDWSADNCPQCPEMPCGEKCLYEYNDEESNEDESEGEDFPDLHIPEEGKWSNSFIVQL